MYQKPKHEPKVTAKGTELPLMDLKGKPYLQVAHRIVWFRETYPTGTINTEMVACNEESAVFKATVLVFNSASGKYDILATGYKRETLQGFPDFIEKSETGAVGRALAMSGFGTQFEPELDEGDRLADSPIEPAKGAKRGVSGSKNAQGKSVVRENGSPAEQPATGAISAGGLTPIPSGLAEGATVDPAASAPVASSAGGTPAAGLRATAKNRNDVNNLLSSVSRSLAAKRILKVDDIKLYMRGKYGTDDKAKLDDLQAGELLQYLDDRNNPTASNGATA